MEDLDLDQFILDIEQSAPQEDSAEPGKHRCRECDAILEDVDGVFICPNCSAQDTNIVEYQEPEIAFDEDGHPYMGQHVALFERKKKHKIDYGWAWSTDEAIIHILDLQVDALTKKGLVPDYFRQGVRNLWIKFWVQDIAPYIRDQYDEEELVPISVKRALKMRDIEILFKVQDKVLLPSKPRRSKSSQPRISRMLGARFVKDSREQTSLQDQMQQVHNELSSFDGEQPVKVSMSPGSSDDDDDSMILNQEQPPEQHHAISTGAQKIENVSILTLNRTIAFIEAAARCLDLPEPIFAADIIRACNQRLIPFFGAHKTLPDGMKLNFMDKFAFQRNRAPTVQYLNNDACKLLYRIFGTDQPLKLQTPQLSAILKRYFKDLNLPSDIFVTVKNTMEFSEFKPLRNFRLKKIGKSKYTKYPMYDRWAFAILISQLKRIFVLNQSSVVDQRNYANNIRETTGQNCFVFYDWIRQLGMRLKLATTYDPYMLYHPMADVNNLRSSPQMYKYLNVLIGDRDVAETRVKTTFSFNDDDLRAELRDFLSNEIPIPYSDSPMFEDEELESPADPRYPITEAFRRTQRFWKNDVYLDIEHSKLLYQDFRKFSTVTLESAAARRWSIYDKVTFRTSGNQVVYEIMPQWPFCFRLLLSVGAYVCYCQPKDILQLVVAVEHHLYPQMNVQRRLMRAREREASRPVPFPRSTTPDTQED